MPVKSITKVIVSSTPAEFFCMPNGKAGWRRWVKVKAIDDSATTADEASITRIASRALPRRAMAAPMQMAPITRMKRWPGLGDGGLGGVGDVGRRRA